MSVSISIILDTRRMKPSKRYPIKLRVTFQRVTEYYQTVFDLTKNEWEKFSASRIGNELQTVKDRLKEIESHALDSIKKIEPFNFEDLKEILFIIIQISGNANRKCFCYALH